MQVKASIIATEADQVHKEIVNLVSTKDIKKLVIGAAPEYATLSPSIDTSESAETALLNWHSFVMSCLLLKNCGLSVHNFLATTSNIYNDVFAQTSLCMLASVGTIINIISRHHDFLG